MGRLPNLFIPGFQKSATSTLFSCLTQHPDIGGPTHWRDLDRLTFPKEVHFFDNNFERGTEFYESIYEGAEEIYRLDGTPNYISSERCMSRLIKIIPDARFIVSMRSPVERILSAWNHWNQLEADEKWPLPNPDGSLLQNIQKECTKVRSGKTSGGLLGMGCYAAHIERAMELAPREQFHFTFTEALNDNFDDEILKIHQFLKIEPRSVPMTRKHQRARTIPEPSSELLEFLKAFYRPENEKLESLLEVKVPW